MKKLLVVLSAWILLISCGPDKEECAFVPETDAIHVNLTIESLQDSLPSITTKEELVHFLGVHPEIRDVFLNRDKYPSDSAFVNALFRRFTNPYIDTLLMETHRVFGDGSGLKKEFEQAYANITYYYPNFRAPKIQTIITGLESDIYVSDSLVIVGLDYFLGQGAKFRPNMFEYMLRRYNPDFIVPSVMLLTGVDSRFNRTDPNDKTILADMVGYGKAYFFSKRMLPCTPDSILIGYSQKEMRGCRENENLIWSRFVEDEVLFSSSHLIRQKFIAERPKTIEVGEQCPGRIGQWVGWQMVNRYQETHPDTPLSGIMGMESAEQLFKTSGYKPQVVKLGK
jgi:hypothetical protein